MLRAVGSIAVTAFLLAGCTGGNGRPPLPPATTDITTTAPTTMASTQATVESSTEAPAPSTTMPLPPDFPCPTFSGPVATGQLASTELDEISGLAFSRATPGVLWMHNDSGGEAAVYAVDGAGSLISRTHLIDIIALDWEDMAIGPGSESAAAALYVADIGDNLGIRPAILIHRFPEPDPHAGDTEAMAEQLILRYPDGPRDAEALIVDPLTGDIAIITKRRGEVFTTDTPAFGGAADLTFAGTLEIDEPATAASIDASGSRIVVRTPASIVLWQRTPDQSLEQALQGVPCELPAPQERLGEAIALSPDGSSYVTVSEGVGAVIFTATER